MSPSPPDLVGVLVTVQPSLKGTTMYLYSTIPPTRRLARGFTAVVAALALSMGLVSLQTTTAEAAPNLIINGTFDNPNAAGVPEGWGEWKAAGTATVSVEPTAGPRGDRALRIQAEPTNDLTVRRAVTQKIRIDDSAPRSMVLRGFIKGENIAASGFTAIRMQGRDAANVVTIPVAYHGRASGTFAWTPVEAYITIPDGTRELAVEPMLDRSGGTIWFADLSLGAATAAGRLSVAIATNGFAELSWNFAPETPSHYAIHRATGDTAPVVEPGTLLRIARAETAADEDTVPGETYTYVVVALDDSGAAIAESGAVTVTIPDEVINPQLINVMTAFASADAVEVGWRLNDATLAKGDLTIRAGASPDATLTDLATVPVGTQHVTLPAGSGPYLQLVQGGAVLDYTIAGGMDHPRSIVDDAAIARVRQQIVDDPTIEGAWDQLVKRVTTGTYGGEGAMLYKARDAAFAYAVTQDASYITIAHEATLAGGFIVAPVASNQGLILGRANLLLSAIYDWAYEGFSETQRADVRNLIAKAADLMSTYHHDNLDGPDKASNWIGVASTTELAALMAVRGDGDIGLREGRIAYLSNLVRLHLQQGYRENGYTQEGWDYFHYAGLYMLPSAYAAIGDGHISLVPELERPQWWNLALHTLSGRESLDMIQWGVGTPKNQSQGILPMLMPLTPDDAIEGIQWVYDQTRGIGRDVPIFDGVHDPYTILLYPGGQGDISKLTASEAHEAIMDDGPGFYAFRNAYTGPDDVLTTLNNRNSIHKGWSGSETFGLSLIGFDTSWALMAGKSPDPKLFSVPLVDGLIQPRGQYTTERAEGVTLESRRYAEQGGGYVHLDGHRNFEVASATREAIVDMSDDVTVLAFDDMFADGETSHAWDWQVHPGPDVVVSVGEETGADADFVLTSPGGVVTGCVIGDARVHVTDGNLQISQTGTSAHFQILMAVAATRTTLTCGDDGVVDVAGRSVDMNALADFVPSSAITPTPTPTPSASPSPSPSPSPSATATATATATPTTAPTVTVTVTTTPVVDVYSTPGYHRMNDRIWFTACEPYSQTTRCRTDIWSTQVTHLGGGKFSSTTGWFFNNLTYLPEMTRAAWGENPLANTGNFTSAGRNWRTECDTDATGGNGCRSFIWATGVVEAQKKASGGYRYVLVNKWVFNNIVRFS
ncbi:MAG: hypothetical protein Q4P15_03040 [Propionibacteriaceae bacterium]|nr:hypothetical protein [Propionibacteriaceae bacterium]